MEQVIGARRSLNARFIDFDNPANNQFHMAAEFSVERARSVDTRRPDIVLFVNGIPMAVIENKKAADDVEQGVSQSIRNQKPEETPHLYVYAQVLLSVNKNDNRYATTGTPAKLWNVWRENEIGDDVIRGLIDTSLTPEQHDALFSDEFANEGMFDRCRNALSLTKTVRLLVCVVQNGCCA